MAEYDGDLYFGAEDKANNIELWKSDGTEAGTMMVRDIHTSRNSYPSKMTVSGGLRQKLILLLGLWSKVLRTIVFRSAIAVILTLVG